MSESVLSKNFSSVYTLDMLALTTSPSTTFHAISLENGNGRQFFRNNSGNILMMGKVLVMCEGE